MRRIERNLTSVVVCLSIVQCFPLHAQTPANVLVPANVLAPANALAPVKDLDHEIAHSMKTALAATVSLVEAKNGPAGAFSGVVVSREGHILAAAHAVSVGMKYRVRFRDGRIAHAIALGLNRRMDCAMIQITDSGEWPFAEMGDSSQLQVGQPVLAIGYPGDQNQSRNRGAVVRLGSVLKPLTSHYGMIQSSACMEPGDSGGGLFDLDGQLVGIRSQIQQPLNDNFDIPVNSFREYWELLSRSGEFPIETIPGLPEVGFRTQRSRRSNGRVQQVDEDSPASEAGLMVDDLILEVEGNRRGRLIDQINERFLDGDREIELTIQRANQRKTLTLRLETKVDEHAVQQGAGALWKNRTSTPDIRITLQNELADLEARLDDHVAMVSSTVDGNPSSIRGLLTRDDLVVTKSSCVGDLARVDWVGGQSAAASIVHRDPAWDLVLLRLERPHRIAAPMIALGDDQSHLGKIVVTPDPSGTGWTGLCGSTSFGIPKNQGRGFLGVRLVEKEGKVLLEDVFSDGAAERSGWLVGDQIVQIGDKSVARPEDVYSFLRSTIPTQRVAAVIDRQGERKEESVILGELKSDTPHIADWFEGGRSPRRDGFPSVFCHDSRLHPDQCGGPLFDSRGALLGLTIARYSRTLCFAIPMTKVEEFVNRSIK